MPKVGKGRHDIGHPPGAEPGPPFSVLSTPMDTVPAMNVNLLSGAPAPAVLCCAPSEAQALFGMTSLLDTFDEDRPRRNRRAGEENVIPLERRVRSKSGRTYGRSLLGPLGAAPETGPGSGSDEAPAMVYLALSLMGPHSPELVDLVARAVGEAHANIEDSRMTRLGAEFAMLVLVSVERRRQPQLQSALEEVARLHGLGLLVRETSRPPGAPGTAVHVELNGLDHEGVLRALTRHLAEQGMEVEDLEARVSPPSATQVPRATVSLKIQVPAELTLEQIQEGLRGVAASQHVDIEVRFDRPFPARTWEPLSL